MFHPVYKASKYCYTYRLRNFHSMLFCNLVFAAIATPVRVAIIGAGPTGTKVASLLEELDDVSVDIFEAGKYVGGRTLSRTIQLSNGRNVTLNTGTQMNFEAFFDAIPELRKLERSHFVYPGDKVLLASATVHGARSLELVERNADINDPERTRRIGGDILRSSILTSDELAAGGLTGFKMYDQMLRGKRLDDLRDYYSSRSDNTDAESFLLRTSFELQKYTGWGDVFGAARLTAEYLSTPNSYRKATLASNILENAVYYGVGYRQRKSVSFPKPYIDKLIESFESLVEFSDLKDMSALNFLWQLNWSASGGKMMICRRWNSVPEYYMEQARKASLHLNSRVTSVEKLSSEQFKVSVENSEPMTFDMVINTAETDIALKMQNFKDSKLEDMLKSNTYTSTVAIHIEISRDASQFFSGGVGLVAEPGFLNKLGGVMIQSFSQAQNYGGKDVIGLFARTSFTKDLIQKYDDEELLAKEAHEAMAEELQQLAWSTRDNRFIEFAKLVADGSIVSSKVWKQALPEFRTGYMQKVMDYRNSEPEHQYYYMGQAVYGRSIVMVIPGVEHDFPKLKKGIAHIRRRAARRQ
jgi:protoporphyrinogen oxidase